MKTNHGHMGYLWACFKGYGLQMSATLIFLSLARVASTFDPVYLKKIIDALGAHKPFAVMGMILVRN